MLRIEYQTLKPLYKTYGMYLTYFGFIQGEEPLKIKQELIVLEPFSLDVPLTGSHRLRVMEINPDYIPDPDFSADYTAQIN